MDFVEVMHARGDVTLVPTDEVQGEGSRGSFGLQSDSRRGDDFVGSAGAAHKKLATSLRGGLALVAGEWEMMNRE